MMPLLFWYLRITARSEITAIKKEDNIVVKEYVNGAGYRIKASEKAYNLLYKKNGFLPVEAIGTNMGESPADDTSPMGGEEVSRESTGGKPKRDPGGKKASSGKAKKAFTVQDAAEQAGDEEIPTDTEKAGGDGTGQDTTGQAGDGETSIDAEKVNDYAAHQDTTEQSEGK